MYSCPRAPNTETYVFKDYMKPSYIHIFNIQSAISGVVYTGLGIL